ncbi:site-specific integrase [Cupriavidus gilardii]|uniref:site-specific integrase n=1 Tax=Cupriavidus gilardii TaxID=82541 RepID=UPI0021B3AA48|nr:site-specific integrase [Cupriavidus gilardii]UXC34765.1 site-specific integrase [Cupriavidus gilardii]
MASIIKIGNKWRAQVRRKGHPPVTRTFDKKSLAERWALQVEGEIRGGAFADERKLAEFTIGALIERYEEEVGKLRPFGRSKAGALAMVKRHVGETPILAFTEAKVMEYARLRRGMGAGGVTIGMELTYISGAYETARSVWKMPLPANPVAAARKHLTFLGLIGKSKRRDRRPTPHELTAICDWFAAKKRQRIPMPDIIRFAVASAMRAGEITRLRWADINESDRTIVIRDRKDPKEKIGNNQVVPLLGEAWDIIQAQPRTGELIFPYKEASFSTLFPRACADLGIEDLRFHDLRHEGVSRLFEAGYTIEQVALVSGHKDWKQLARYTQLRAASLHRPRDDQATMASAPRLAGGIIGFALRRRPR